MVKGRVQTAAIQWVVDEPYHKEAEVHILTHNASYTLLVGADILIVGSETYVNITAQLNPQGESSWVFIAVPDTITDAPYALGQPVPAFHIVFPSWFATGLALAMVIVLIFGVFFFFEALLTQIAAGLVSLLGQNFFFWASIPWVYLSIYGRDRNSDGTIAFDVPYDSTNLSYLANGFMYVATSKSWWIITKCVWAFRLFGVTIFSVTYYEAAWTGIERVTISPTLLSPWVWFEWNPTSPVVGQQVVFVSTSFDADGSITSSHWMFGDGFEAFGKNVTHTYSTTGWHTVSLEITDNDGLTNSTSATVLVANRILNITANSPANILVETPDGSLVGYDSTTKNIFLEIAGASYTGPASEPQNAVLPNPQAGTYVIRIVGTETGEYTLTAEVVGEGGTIIDSESWSHSIHLGEIHAAVFQLSPEGSISNPTFNVIPEVPLGTVAASAAMIIALVAYMATPKWRRKGYSEVFGYARAHKNSRLSRWGQPLAVGS